MLRFLNKSRLFLSYPCHCHQRHRLVQANLESTFFYPLVLCAEVGATTFGDQSCVEDFVADCVMGFMNKESTSIPSTTTTGSTEDMQLFSSNAFMLASSDSLSS